MLIGTGTDFLQTPAGFAAGITLPESAGNPEVSFWAQVQQALISAEGVSVKQTQFIPDAPVREPSLPPPSSFPKFYEENGRPLSLCLQWLEYMQENPDLPRIPLSRDDEQVQQFMEMMFDPDKSLEDLMAFYLQMTGNLPPPAPEPFDEVHLATYPVIDGVLPPTEQPKTAQGAEPPQIPIVDAEPQPQPQNLYAVQPTPHSTAENPPLFENPTGTGTPTLNVDYGGADGNVHESDSDVKNLIRQLIFGENHGDENLRATPEQIEQALKLLESHKNGKATAVIQNAAKSEADGEKPEAWELFDSARLEIKQKPDELNQLQRFKGGMEAEQKATEQKSAEPDEPEKTPATESLLRAPDGDEAQKTVITGKTAQLPQAETARISAEIAANSAKLTTAKDGAATFEMTLNPEELGKITVKLVVKATGVQAEITAEKASTALLLQNSADKIGAALEKADARLESFIVAAENQPDYSEQRENQGGNRGFHRQSDEEEEPDEQSGISFSELLSTL